MGLQILIETGQNIEVASEYIRQSIGWVSV